MTAIFNDFLKFIIIVDILKLELFPTGTPTQPVENATHTYMA